MSKSDHSAQSRILLTDTHEDIIQKVKWALTDSMPGISYDPVHRPGISNLIDIVHHLEGGGGTCVELARTFESFTKAQFKEAIAERISSRLSPMRIEYERILNTDDGRLLDAVAAQGAVKARASAEETMALVRGAIGLGS